MKEIIALPDGTEYGFGYEELRGIKNHNPACFDENKHCKNDELKKFIKKHLYRHHDDFKYNDIMKKIIIPDEVPPC